MASLSFALRFLLIGSCVAAPALAVSPGTQSDVTLALTLTSSQPQLYPDGSDGEEKDGEPDTYKISGKKYTREGELVAYNLTGKVIQTKAKYTTKQFLTDLLHAGNLGEGETSIAGWSLGFLSDYNSITESSSYEPGFYAIKKSGKKVASVINVSDYIGFIDFIATSPAGTTTGAYQWDASSQEWTEKITYNFNQKSTLQIGLQPSFEHAFFRIQGIITESYRHGPVKLGRESYELETAGSSKISSISGSAESGYDDDNTVIEGSISLGKSKVLDLDTLFNEDGANQGTTTAGSVIVSTNGAGAWSGSVSATNAAGTMTLYPSAALNLAGTTAITVDNIAYLQNGQGLFVNDLGQTLTIIQPSD